MNQEVLQPGLRFRPRKSVVQRRWSQKQEDDIAPGKTPLNLCEYLKSREGKTWRQEDTLRILKRAAQIDDLIEQLIRAAGIPIVKDT